MKTNGIAVLCVFAVIAFAQATPVPKTENAIASKLENYLHWMTQATDLFDDQFTSSDLDDLERLGQRAHDQLIGAIRDNDPTIFAKPELPRKVLVNLEREMNEAKLLDDESAARYVGVVFADSFESSQGARIAIASRLFDQLALKLQARLDLIKDDETVDADDLESVVENVSAAEIAFDAIVTSFRAVRAVQPPVLRRQKRQINLPGAPPIGGSSLPNMFNNNNNRNQNRFGTFGANGLNLGGGFSTNGESVVFNRRQETVTVTPHYSLTPKPRYHGTTAGYEHRFRNGRGSIFGSATVDNRGRFQSGGVGVRINF